MDDTAEQVVKLCELVLNDARAQVAAANRLHDAAFAALQAARSSVTAIKIANHFKGE